MTMRIAESTFNLGSSINFHSTLGDLLPGSLNQEVVPIKGKELTKKLIPTYLTNCHSQRLLMRLSIFPDLWQS
uniref:Uncharacterized protein n=1 Tax=Mustela putorius furo TaxID=9669 RepID=M3XQP1_MUSPF